MRAYPALDVTWSDHPGVPVVELLIAEVDEYGPLAVEDLPAGARLFFDNPTARDLAADRIRNGTLGASCVAIEVPDEDWAARSQASLGPVQVGRLTVTPPWATPPLGDPDTVRDQSDRALTIVIRPAMGFGSGHHASTRLALALLQQAPVAGADVIDAGTGSGVLALAAWRLGAASATGFDRDTDALTSARESLALNPGAVVTLVALDLAGAVGRLGTCDVITANLTGELLARSAGVLGELTRPGGYAVLSGILSDEAALVLASYVDRGWKQVVRLEEDEWVGLLLRKPSDVTSPSEPTAR
jgi:ribosomal protein L11 methyltransferase